MPWQCMFTLFMCILQPLWLCAYQSSWSKGLDKKFNTHAVDACSGTDIMKEKIEIKILNLSFK